MIATDIHNNSMVAEAVEPPADTATGNVTEIFLGNGFSDNIQLLLPMLTQLVKEERWLACIDPPHHLLAKRLHQEGVRADHILILRSNTKASSIDLAERAMMAGTCHAAVIWQPELSRHDYERLNQASAAGRCHGVVVRGR